MSKTASLSLRLPTLCAVLYLGGCCCVSSPTAEQELKDGVRGELSDLGEEIAKLDESEENDDAPSLTNLPPLAAPDFTMSAAALAEEFAADKEATKKKYGFKSIRVDGKVIEVGKDESGVPFVVLEGHEAMPVSVGFPAARSAYVEKINQGSHVVLQGNFASFLSDSEVSLYDGGIVSYEK